jgi:hypothetical protein
MHLGKWSKWNRIFDFKRQVIDERKIKNNWKVVKRTDVAGLERYALSRIHGLDGLMSL